MNIISVTLKFTKSNKDVKKIKVIKFNSKLSAGARNSTLSSLASCKMSLKYSDVVFFEISVKVLLTYF